MEMLAAEGYECHALDFSQTGRYRTSYREQIDRIRHYILEQLDDRPVLIGHGHGGLKCQLYMLASHGDAMCAADCSVRAMVLMASTFPKKASSLARAVCDVASAVGAGRALLAGSFGAAHLDPLCFLHGGGPMRHVLYTYPALFNPSTRATTLMSETGAADARVTLTSSDGDLSTGLPIARWADTYLADHEPIITDGVSSVLSRGRTRATMDALAANACDVLHLVAANDRLVQRAQTDETSRAWQVDSLVVEGQGHQFGDAGWEEHVMTPLRAFLDRLT